jgi:regulator of protease activity HflC (stomatin/prohibitin superfamily)
MAGAPKHTMLKQTIQSYETGLLFKNGKFVRRVGPGRHWTVFGTELVPVDMRTRQDIVASQEILTVDNLSVRVSVVVTYCVIDPEAYVLKAQYPEALLHTSAQLALRESVGARSFEALRQDKGEVGAEVMASMGSTRESLGIDVLRAVVRDLMPPGALKKAYAQVEAARQEGLAALERARGETAALRNLANAARMLEGRPELLALRTLQAMEGTQGNVFLLNRILGNLPNRPPQTMPEEG